MFCFSVGESSVSQLQNYATRVNKKTLDAALSNHAAASSIQSPIVSNLQLDQVYLLSRTKPKKRKKKKSKTGLLSNL